MESKKVTCIIQARTNSRRLKNKVLVEIEKTPMICHVINRVKNSKNIHQIILATTDQNEDKILLKIAEQYNIIGFAGNETDVLDRYYQAALCYNGDPIIRITGDCPLVDPGLIDQMIEFYQDHDYDYVSNTISRTFPDGLDIEIFSFDVLKKINIESRWKSEREHVTPYIIKNKEFFKIHNFENTHDLSNLRWTVDEEADLVMIRKIFEEMRPNILFTIKDILKLLLNKPEISEINNKIGTNEGYLESLKDDKIITDDSNG